MDEYSDDYYISMPDGSEISVSESLSTDSLNECSVSLAALGIVLTAKEAAVLLAAVTVVAAPAVVEVVDVIVTTVVYWVRSFWSWFKSLWSRKTTTIISKTTTYKLSYTVTISQTKIEAKPYDKTKKYELDKYYVAVADTDDGLLYVSSSPVDNLSALAILTTSAYVKSAHKNSNKSFVVSLYTKSSSSASLIATEAGTILGSPGAIHHDAKKLGYFKHYHPGLIYSDISHPHVFYGEPKA